MLRILILLLAIAGLQEAYADISVSCSKGCIQIPESERTQNLLLLNDDATSITLTWTKSTPPARREVFTLTAGNPITSDQLPNLGLLDFQQSTDAWTASRDFDVRAMGKGTFIAALIRESRGKESIAYWRAFRFKTLEEGLADADGIAFPGLFTLEVIPEYIQVSTAHGELPKNTGGNEKVWWQIPQSLGGVNVDLDGDHTGVPGLTIVHSPVWESQANDWQQSVRENLKGIVGHFIDFEEIEFKQVADRTITVGGEIDEIILKHYYGVVSLYTNATAKNFTAADLGQRGSKRFFAHETSANFKQQSDPRLWASYSRIAYSADPRLLKLIQSSVKKTGTVPGLSNVQLDDGDGGHVFYSVALKARVQPWSVPATNTRFVPGFVHIDVVASRYGIGDIDTQNELEGKGLCKIIMCRPGETKVNLNSPPEGYRVAHPIAILGTKPGTASVIAGEMLTAEKNFNVADDGFEFPNVSRYALGAQLRAGSLTQVKRSWGTDKPLEMLPINSYAQFVIKYTVAMLPETVAPQEKESIVPSIDDVNTIGPVPPPPPPWWKGLFSMFGWPGMIVGGLLVLALFWFLLPPVRIVLKSIARLLAAIIDRLASWIQPK